VLERVSNALAERRDELARTTALEGGKPITAARVEAERASFTFKVAAEEAKRIYGEVVPLDWLPGNEGRVGHVRRVPLGPIAGISPFNFPLNLVAHKVAPALAAGNPIIVRPASQTPVSALKLARIVLDAGWPEDGIAVVPSSTDDARPLIEDERIKLLTFTGSPAVGWSLKAQAGRKRVTLELGGNAGVIVHSDADLDMAAQRIAFGAYYQAGQSCISVQRVLVASEVYDEFAQLLTKQVEQLITGDPMDEKTDVGPVITHGEVDRIAEWVAEAERQGAEVLTGGKADGPFFQPTLLSQTTPEMKVRCEEVFGPVATISPYQTFDEALAEVNNSKYGLQAGVFTNDINRAFEAHRTLEVGGVIINDVSAFRADQMPYGGSKDSGFGREGLKWAMEEMTEPRIMVLSHVPL
jgi:acyl-CoA reductase-like NAD-dependent aldehyde dehydrogenase